MAFCNEEGCDALTTGKCINGLVLDECPHYKETDDVEDLEVGSQENESNESGETEKKASDMIELYSGKALKVNEVNRISSAAVSRLIILAGMPDAGKTTLLLSLMHLFQTKPEFENYLFAGSETLLDFEEKAHPSKAESESTEENTGRTPIGPPTFLHLSVTNKQSDVNTNLIFTDISGELFDALKDNTEQCKNFTLAERADHFVILFDAERITTLQDRGTAKASGIGILKSLIQAGTLKPHTRIQVVISRWDLYLKKGRTVNNDEYITVLKSDIKKLFGETFDVEFFEISARPKKNLLTFGYGIEKIFPFWVNQSILDGVQKKIKLPTSKTSRQYLQYNFND